MTKLRHQQPSLWHPGLTKDIEDLWEPWMRLVDRLLEDEQLVDTIHEAQKGTVSAEPKAGTRANAGRSVRRQPSILCRASLQHNHNGHGCVEGKVVSLVDVMRGSGLL
jgi:hypothetical protein